MSTLIVIDTPYAYFGLVVRAGTVVQAPPIAKWCVGKPILYVIGYYQNHKAAKVEEVRIES